MSSYRLECGHNIALNYVRNHLKTGYSEDPLRMRYPSPSFPTNTDEMRLPDGFARYDAITAKALIDVKRGERVEILNGVLNE